MSVFPLPGEYNIFSAESYGNGPAGATIRSGEDALRGSLGTPLPWSLSYYQDIDKGICVLGGEGSGGFLGLPQFSTGDGVVYLLKGTQEWTLKKTKDGYSISQVLDQEEMFWHLDNEGGKIRIARASEGIQSWVFKTPA